MKFERSTIIGFVLLAVLFFGYFWFNSQEQNKQIAWKKEEDRIKFVQDSTKRYNDSIVIANRPKTTDTSSTQIIVATANDSLGFKQAFKGTETTTEAGNDLMSIVFTNKGGQPKFIELKKFKGPDSVHVIMGDSDFDKINYKVEVAKNESAYIDTLFFSPAEKTTTADGSTTITYQLKSTEGKIIRHQYIIHPNNYMVDFTISIDDAQKILGTSILNLIWQANVTKQQKDISYERGQSQVGFRYQGDYDHEMITGGGSKQFNSTVNWVAVKQQFFNYTLLCKSGFTSGNLIWTGPADSSHTIAYATANMQVPIQNNQVALSFYYGPNDYSTLKQYNNDMEDMVDLGSGIFAFVKYINRFVVLPAFNFFDKFTNNYGIVILLLTLLIRLLISPLTYKSYLSGAKMKVLRPEIEQLKAKHGTDQQAMSVAQMKLFNEAGVSPLGGCIPALAQIPIFFALYSFFNSNVALRGQGFLWADDLSQYDSIANLSFSIPLYGDHVSLFTITAVLTSFLISIYSMSMTPDQNNPVLKYMPYFFPFILLFVFNALPAGLTWYYTVSNLITLLLQFVIQNYIIDHDKILANIEANRKKPKTKSKWQEKMEQMQEQQKTMQQRRTGKPLNPSKGK